MALIWKQNRNMKNPMHDHIIELHKAGLKNYEICYWLTQTRNAVAGIIWRYKNPGMYKKNVPKNRIK